MYLDNEMEKLRTLVFTACKEHYFKEIKNLDSGSIESYALFCDSAAVSVGVAISTNKSSLVAALWENINRSFECFSGANVLVHELDDLQYDDVFEDYPVEVVGEENAERLYYRKKIGAICDAIKDLSSSGFFNQDEFSKEVFISIQFPDPDEKQKKETLEYCQKFNTAEVVQRFSQELLYD